MDGEGGIAETRQRAGIEESAAVCRSNQVSTWHRSPVLPPTALAFRLANDLLFPARHAAPGRRRSIMAMLTQPVTWGAVRHWMAGRRKTPQWARELLLAEIEKRIAALEHVKALLLAIDEPER